MSDTQDDLTVAYMAGFHEGKQLANQDTKRLDWLLEHVICSWEKTWHPKDTEYLTSREEIDEAMRK